MLRQCKQCTDETQNQSNTSLKGTVEGHFTHQKKDHNVWDMFFSELQNAAVRYVKALNGFG